MKQVWLNIIRLVLLGGILGTVSSCSGLASPDSPSNFPTTDWIHAKPEERGMDSEMLVQMLGYIEAQDLDLHSLLIVRNGYLVLEAYWHPYSPTDVHTTQSVTKTVIGTLIGIAIAQGEIESVDASMVDFFPPRTIDNLDDWKKSITVGDLLSMTSGLDCEDRKVLESARQTDDWTQYFLDRRMLSAPGSAWTYCSGSAHLLSAILQQSTGENARNYANQYLFVPLGISEVPELDWSEATDGVTDGIAGLYLTPRDLAKLGYLHLQRGTWEQEQVLSRSWVQESTLQQTHIGPDAYVGGRERGFGYMWSIFAQQGYYGYLGMAGQGLFVHPQEKLVVVFTGALRVGEEGELLTLIDDYILPSIVEDHPIPVNDEAGAGLEAMLQSSENPARVDPQLPARALEFSGAHYRLASNYLGWPDMMFLFEPGSSTAILRMQGSPDLTIGLDGRYRLTEVPDTRPVGLRGEWIDADTFFLDYILFGEFIHSVAYVHFNDDSIDVNIDYLNYATPTLSLHGERD